MKINWLILLFLLAFADTSLAEPYKLPLQLDYGLIKKAVVSQLFKGESGSVEVWHDKKGCSSLKLANPRISGQNGLLKLINDVDAQIGTSLAGRCLTLLNWRGDLESLHRPTISAEGSTLSIPVSQVTAYDSQGRKVTVDKLQELLTKVVQPKLAEVKVDLNKSRTDIEKTLAGIVPKAYTAEVKPTVDSLKFSHAEANDKGVKVELAFDAPAPKALPKAEAPFTEAEQKQWQSIWREWDAFLSDAVEKAAKDAQSKELREALNETLQESRSAFQSAMKAQKPETGDPVRTLFIHTWEKLSPQLHTLAKQLPEVEGLNYLTFIAATDIIYQLNNLGAPFGLELSSDGLRRIVRLLMANKTATAQN